MGIFLVPVVVFMFTFGKQFEKTSINVIQDGVVEHREIRGDVVVDIQDNRVEVREALPPAPKESTTLPFRRDSWGDWTIDVNDSVESDGKVRAWQMVKKSS